jgi:membrane protein
VWIVGLALYITASITLEQSAADHAGGARLVRLGAGIVAVVFYTWTPYVLLGRRIRRRSLAPTVALTLAGTAAFALASAVYMPGILSAQAERHGVIGFAFSFLTWLFAQSVVMVAAAILGAAITERWAMRRAAR